MLYYACSNAACSWSGALQACVYTKNSRAALCPWCHGATACYCMPSAPHTALLTALHAVTPAQVARLSAGQVTLVRGMLRDYGLMEGDTHG